MYTSNNINVYHFLLDLKLGLPIAIKKFFGKLYLIIFLRKYNGQKFDANETSI